MTQYYTTNHFSPTGIIKRTRYPGNMTLEWEGWQSFCVYLPDISQSLDLLGYIPKEKKKKERKGGKKRKKKKREVA